MPLITMADVQQHLNLNPGDLSHLGELQGFIDAATEVITGHCGDVTPVARVDTLDGGRAKVVLRHAPATAVATVTEYGYGSAQVLPAQPLGVVYPSFGYTFEPEPAVVTKRAGDGSPMVFTVGPVVVAYTSGRSLVPANIRLAALELVRTNYQQTQQSGRPVLVGSMADDAAPMMPGDWLPKRVEQLLAPYRRGPTVG